MLSTKRFGYLVNNYLSFYVLKLHVDMSIVSDNIVFLNYCILYIMYVQCM